MFAAFGFVVCCWSDGGIFGDDFRSGWGVFFFFFFLISLFCFVLDGPTLWLSMQLRLSRDASSDTTRTICTERAKERICLLRPIREGARSCVLNHLTFLSID